MHYSDAEKEDIMALPANKKNRIKHKDEMAINILACIVVGLVAFISLVPFYVIIVSSFRSEASIITKGHSLIPQDLSLTAYEFIFRTPKTIIRAYLNTIFVTLVGTFLAVMMSTMTGYVLQRPDFEWRNKIAFFFFFTTLFNGGLVPTYMIMTQIFKFKNSYHALILPMAFSVWNMIISKTFMRSISYELTEAAKIDGANDVRIFFTIIFPLARPLVATIGLFTALGYWNDWYQCMLYESKEEMYNLQFFLNEIINGIQGLKAIASMGGTVDISLDALPSETMKMAMTVVAIGPIIFLYPFVQKFFVKGLTIGSVKG